MAAIAALVGLACGDPGVAPPDPPRCDTHDDPRLELGTGQEAFEPLVEEQELRMAAGPQGGCHFWLGLRTDGFAERRFNVRYEVLYADTGTTTGSASNQTVRLLTREDAPGRCEFYGFIAYLIRPWTFEDRRVRIEVTVTDDLGRRAQAARTVLARWPQEVTGIPRDELCGPRR